ncbi:MAG: carbohydrate-binding protein [Angelakisella sp.]
MEPIRIKIIGGDNRTLAVSRDSGCGVSLVYMAAYLPGDRIMVDVSGQPGLYVLQLDEALPAALVYLEGAECIFPLPLGEEHVCYSPKAFWGSCHLLTARAATAAEVAVRRNMAFNPYDRHTTRGIFPHATANVETRNEAVFAARNAIDGIFENSSHGVYPYSSWGINRDPEAQLRLEFGRPVQLDSLRLTLRADFPHDNWWTSAEVAFSDGSTVTMSLQKSALPQQLTFEPKTVEWLVLGKLIPADDPSPFPALIQLEAFGVEG